MLFIKHVLCTACTPCISMNNNFCGKEKFKSKALAELGLTC